MGKTHTVPAESIGRISDAGAAARGPRSGALSRRRRVDAEENPKYSAWYRHLVRV